MARTKTDHRKSPKSIDHEHAQRSTWENAAELYNSLTTDSEFYELSHQQNVDVHDSQSPEYASITSDYITQFCEARLQDGTLNETTATQLLLTANLPIFFWQQAELLQMQGQTTTEFTPPEKQRCNELKESIISYNQLVSNYLYEHPDTSLNEIVAATASSSLSHVPSYIGGAREQLTMLRGARTEAIGRHLLDELSRMAPDRLSYRPATIDEDKRGADVIVDFDGRQFGLDFKSSLDGVEANKNGDFYEHMSGVDFHIQDNRKPGGITTARLVPQINEVTLEGMCRLPETELMPAVLHMSDQLVKLHRASSSTS